jgi:hypothetical protein
MEEHYERSAEFERIKEKAESRIEEERQAFSDEKPSAEEPGSAGSSPLAGFLLDCAKSGEVGDARVLIYLLMGLYRYDHASGRWYKWQGHYWGLDLVCDVVAEVDKIIKIYQ